MKQPDDPLGHQKEAVSVREYLEYKIDAVEKQSKLENLLNQRAIQVAQETMNVRLESMNEFRGQITDQQKTFVSKAEWQQFVNSTNERMNTIDRKVQELETFKAVLAGKASVPANLLSLVLGVISLILGIAAVSGLLKGS